MSLSQEDREWVKDMIRLVAMETLEKSRDFCSDKVTAHSATCPHMRKFRYLLIGIGVGLGVSADAILRAIISTIGKVG